MKDKTIYVTQPSLPPLEKYIRFLQTIWETHQLTNNGFFHQEFEQALTRFLEAEYASIYSNGTLALIAAIKTLELTGEVITTPYSFVATTHVIELCGLKPVFADIETPRLGLDPKAIIKAITPQTSAILPVHVYGIPCRMDEIEAISKEYGLKVIYDAAHAFGVKENGVSILNRGDLSVLSFHATKLFSTIEGGAVICKDGKIKEKLDLFKNFGIENELSVKSVGLNAKMNELQAAFGLLELEDVRDNIAKRKQLAESYRVNLQNLPGIGFPAKADNVISNYNYFPIFVNKKKSRVSRDDIYNLLKEKNIYSRRYFYPLISNLGIYSSYQSADACNLPIANRVSEEVLCLPLYSDLLPSDADYICSLIRQAVCI